MTDPVDAVLAAVRFPVSAVTVYDTVIPDRPVGVKWGAFYPDTGTADDVALCGAGDAVLVRWQVSFWAADAGQARFLARKERDHLTGTWVAADGWLPASVTHELSVQARPDEDVRTLVVCADRYSALFTKETSDA